MLHRFSLFGCCALFVSQTLFAQSSGPLGIDHRINFDESGVWRRGNQKAVEFGSAAFVVAGALYEGNDSRLGKTFWKSLDAMVIGDVSSAVGKVAFRRQRPLDGNDPNAFFHNATDKSFPSGEMTHITAIVTPFIMEYAQESPSAWGLSLLPVYVGVARMKSQAHWQSDILAGGLLGAGAGYYAFHNDRNWSASLLPHGMTVGYKTRF